MKKRLLSLAVAAALVLSLSGCGGVLVDYDTPKSEELSAQYDFYSDSQRELASGMAITPEQADEVFLVLVSCGVDGKVSSVTRKAGDDGHCTVSALGTIGTFDVYYTDGVVDRVEKGGKELYPEMYNLLLDCKVKVADVKNGMGTEVIGQRAYIDILKSQLVAVSEDDYKEFVETVVKDSGYNWFSIMCEDGTGITFPGSMYFVGEYGKQDKDGSISAKCGTISIQNDETYLYEDYIPEPKVYEYDTLQNIFMSITESTTAEELQALITENNLSATVQEYNKGGGGKEVVFCIAYTEGAALQKYADSGDNLEVAFDKIGPDSMSEENRFMYAVYSNASGLSAMLYNYGTWFDFREEAKSDYSGYYIIKHGSKDGITMKYNNGNETATGYFRHDSAEEVIREMIDETVD